MLVNVWTTFPSGEGKYQVGYKVTITNPDGTTEDVNLKSYVADGTSWFTYIPQTVGTWTFVFNFAGEYFPAGLLRKRTIFCYKRYRHLARARFSTLPTTLLPQLLTL